jgi:HK97 family phage major capsid protein
VNEREKSLRHKRLGLVTEARAILDAGPSDAALAADDQARYDALMNEYDAIGTTIESEARAARAEADLAAPVGVPAARPDVGSPADAGRPGRAVATAEYRAAFTRYLVSGVQERALQMDADTAGGFIVAPQQFSDRIIKFVDNAVFIRNLATKFRVPNAESLGVPTLVADPADADWTTELAIGSEDTTMSFGKREFRPNPLAKLLKVSNKLVRAVNRLTEVDSDSSGDTPMTVDEFVVSRLGYKFGVAQEKAFLTGSGALQPLGVFTASADGIDTSRDVACASATAIVGDDLINVKYSLKPQYLAKAAWLFHRDAIKAVRKLKDSNGQYLWAPGGIGQASLTVGSPDTILDLPFYQSEYVPNTFTTGLYVGLLGDFSYYWIADALDYTIQRLVELYAQTNQIGFIGRQETDGMPVLPEAFARVKLA